MFKILNIIDNKIIINVYLRKELNKLMNVIYNNKYCSKDNNYLYHKHIQYIFLSNLIIIYIKFIKMINKKNIRVIYIYLDLRVVNLDLILNKDSNRIEKIHV